MTKQPALENLPFNHTGFNACLGEHKLMAVRCMDCGIIILPPRPLCPQCYGTRIEWAALSGKGVLAGFTTIAVGLPAMIAEGYNRDKPYCSGIVQLEEGPSISGQLIDIDCAHPEQIQVGMAVQAAYIERGIGANHQVFLAFTPEIPGVK
jgi:uncharacterized protein